MTKITFHDIETNQVIEREMNAEELAQYEADKAAFEAEKIALAAKEAARKALLEKLGITADEASLLLG